FPSSTLCRSPAAGGRVLIRPGHTVTYDVKSNDVIRAVQIGGTLSFARDRDTLLNTGLVRIAPGEEYSEEGFECDAHLPAHGGHQARPKARGSRAPHTTQDQTTEPQPRGHLEGRPTVERQAVQWSPEHGHESAT